MRGPICFGAANVVEDGEVRTGAGGLSTLGRGGGKRQEGGHSRNSLVYLQCLAPPYRVTKPLLRLRWAPWLIWALMARGSMTDSLTRISGWSWVMHVVSFFFPPCRHLRLGFLVQKSKPRSWFYRSATWIMVNWTFSVSVRTSKGSGNATFEF